MVDVSAKHEHVGGTRGSVCGVGEMCMCLDRGGDWVSV